VEKYKKILVIDNAFDARHLELVLKERNIPHRIRSYYDSAFDGLFQTQKGWGHVEAPPEYEDEIKALHSSLPEVVHEDDGDSGIEA
jgi:hypothetical protein